jgi:putative ABC transport system ATP-binding protein
MPASLSLQGICKHYAQGPRRIEVLEDLDLEIAAGEFVALTGPSACGKSTLLRVMGGFDRADGGHVEVGGTDVSGLGSAALVRWRAAHVGHVAQLHKLSPWLTVEQNLELPLRLAEVPPPQRAARVQAALQLLGMDGHGAETPAELSAGEQQKIALARALVADPAVLLVDEPTAGLDPGLADEVLDLLELVNQALRTTVVMVTQDPEAVRRAGRCLQMDRRRLRGAAADHARGAHAPGCRCHA